MADDTGLADLQKAVEELTADVRKKVVYAALRAAAKPILESARSKVPIKTGLVKSRIRVAASKVFRGQNGVLGVYINVRPEKGRRVKGTKVRVKVKGGDPYYWRFLELGTKHMRARAFLVPAAEANFTAALDIFKEKLAARIAKANQRKP